MADLTKESYEIKMITSDLEEEMIEHLRKFFSKDEPLNCCSNLVDENNPISEEFEKYTLQDVKDGVSLAAVTSDGKLIGLCLNALRVKGQKEQHYDIDSDKRFSDISNILDHIHQSANVMDNFPDVQKAIEITIISVDSNYRGKGLAKQLLGRTEKLALELGCSLLYVLCTSEFTAKAVARLGFELFYSLDYKDWTREGKPIFTPAPPHTRATVYTKRIGK